MTDNITDERRDKENKNKNKHWGNDEFHGEFVQRTLSEITTRKIAYDFSGSLTKWTLCSSVS